MVTVTLAIWKVFQDFWHPLVNCLHFLYFPEKAKDSPEIAG